MKLAILIIALSFSFASTAQVPTPAYAHSDNPIYKNLNTKLGSASYVGFTTANGDKVLLQGDSIQIFRNNKPLITKHKLRFEDHTGLGDVYVYPGGGVILNDKTKKCKIHEAAKLIYSE